MSVAATVPLPQVVPAQKSLGWPLLGLLVVLVVGCVLRWPVAAIPLERDEGEYAYIAQHWLRGQVPYQTAFDQKPPAVFVVYVLIESVLGTSSTAIHWGLQLYLCGTLALLYYVGWRLFSPLAGFLAALLAAFLTAAPDFNGNAANTEIFALLPATAAFWTTLRAGERDSLGWAFAAGVFSAAALLFKQVVLFEVIFFMWLLLSICRRRRQALWTMLAGMAAVGVPVLAYFIAKGAGWDFYDCVLGYNLNHASEVPLRYYPPRFWERLEPILITCWPILVLAIASLPLAYLVRRDGDQPNQPRPVWLVAGWLASACLAILPGGHFYAHYYLHVVPPLALLAGVGVTVLAALAGRWVGRWGQPMAVVLASGAVLYGVAMSWWYFGPSSPDMKSREMYGVNPFPESAALAQFIAEHSAADDTMFVLGSEPQIAYYANRQSASRYIITYPLWKAFPGTRERQQQVLEELWQNRPAFVVAVDLPQSNLPSPHCPVLLRTGLAHMLDQGYHPVAAIPFSNETPMPLVTEPAALRTLLERRRREPWLTLLTVFERGAVTAGDRAP